MTNALTDGSDSAIAIVATTSARYAEWLQARSAPERAWLAGTASSRSPAGPRWCPAPMAGWASSCRASIRRRRSGRSPICRGKLPEGLYRADLDGAALADADNASQVALGWALGAYSFTRYKAAAREPARLVWPEAARRAEILALAEGTALARDLINISAEDMGPAELAAAAGDLARRHGAALEIIVGDELKRHNYPLIHAVGRGSARAPRLIDLRWGSEDAPKLTLVGKGRMLRFGRARHQDRRRHEADEEGHGRRGDLARPRPCHHGDGPEASAARPHPGGGEFDLRQCLPADGRVPVAQGPDGRDRQYRRRGPPRAVRRAGRSRDREPPPC